MQTLDNQFITPPPRKIEYSVGLFAWVVRAIVAVLLLSAGVQAGYKPVDISNIKGEQRKELEKAAKAIADIPPFPRDGFICERLGLCFKKDGSKAMAVGTWGIYTYEDAWYVGRGGKVTQWNARWSPKLWNRTMRTKGNVWIIAADQCAKLHIDQVLSFYQKDVERLTLSTANYLLKTMPKEQRWMALASIGNMLYSGEGAFERGRGNWEMDCGISVKVPQDEARGCVFMDPDGKEHDIRRAILTAGDKGWRWRQIVWRCENLVGSKDILALFPEEVEAMRKHFKERIAQLKDETKAKNDALLAGADEAMSSLPKEKRLARIALAMGLYYLDHKEAGCADGHLNPNTTIILPDGTELSGEEFVDEAPGLLQQVPHEAILEYYRRPIEQMAKAVAEERFGKMPPVLRDLLRAQLSGKLIKLDGAPAEVKEGTVSVQTFDRAWSVPVAVVDLANTYFKNSSEKTIPYSMYSMYAEEYVQTINLVNLCARILGKEETVGLIPPSAGK